MFKKVRFYPLIAGVYDFYLLAFFLGAIFALSGYLLRVEIDPLIALSILPLGIITVLLYYLFFSRRIKWLSPGELIVGREIGLDNKEWNNPFGYNRWALFLITFVTLAIASNVWDSLGSGYIYSLSEIVLRSILLLVLSYGVVNVGRGQIGSVWLIVAYFVFYAWQLWNTPLGPIPQQDVQMVAISFLVIATLHLVIALLYGFLRGRIPVDLSETAL